MDFDFVIVGAGSAGCAMAARLSESGRYTVALLEAGPKDTNPWIHIPVGYFKTMGNPKTDWMYKTQPDAGTAGRSIPWPRGRVLGGSSSINGLLYVRGQPQDFDTWAQMGCTGWGWDDVWPYFKRAETWNGSDASGLRGTDGPLSVQSSRLSRDVVDHWVDAAVSAGYPFNTDYNGADQEGVGFFQMTMSGGRRCSSAVAYLKPARGRQNLTVFTDAQTQKVIVEGARGGLGAFLYLEVLDASFSFDGVIGAFALTTNILLIAIGLGIGAMYVRSMTIMLTEKGTLQEFKFLEHGAFYSIFALSVIMFLQSLMHVPETLTGLIGVAFIGYALISSIRDNKKCKTLE
jgi:choline dehydrogenase